MTTNKDRIKNEIAESKRIFAETKEQMKEEKRVQKAKTDDFNRKVENWRQSSWDNMSTQQLKAYTTFIKFLSIVIGILNLILSLIGPMYLILSLASFFMAYKFDAYKMTSEYKNEKKAKKLV